MAYTAEGLKDIDITKPTEGATIPSEVNDAIREVKKVMCGLYAVASKGADYTLTILDEVIIGTGTFNVTLATAATVAGSGRQKEYTVVNNGTGIITLVGTIGGIVNSTVPAGKMRSFFTDGTNYYYRDYVPDVVFPIDSSDLILYRYSISVMKVAVTAIALYSTSNTLYQFNSANLTIDIAVSGINGLDTGTEASSTWYYIWAIANGSGGTGGLLSLSATAPTMPSGYTYKRLLGAVYNNSSGDFIDIYQRNKKVAIPVTVAVSNGTAVTYTNVSLSSIIPPNANAVSGKMEAYYVATLGGGVSVASNATPLGETYIGAIDTTTNHEWCYYSVMISTPQQYSYRVYTGAYATLYVTGWEY